MSSKKFPLEHAHSILLLRDLWVTPILVAHEIDPRVYTTSRIEWHVIVSLHSCNLTLAKDHLVRMCEFIKHIFVVVDCMDTITAWKVQRWVVFIHENSLLLRDVLHGLDPIEGVMHWVDDLHHILGGMLPELPHMVKQFLTHVHGLVPVLICCNDIPPIVLKLEIPSFRLLFLLILLKQFLVTVMLVH